MPPPAYRRVANRGVVLPLALAKRHGRENLARPLRPVDERPNPLAALSKQPSAVAQIQAHVLHQPQPPNLPDQALPPRPFLDRHQPEVGRVLGRRVPPRDPPPAGGPHRRLEVGAVILGGLVAGEPDDVVGAPVRSGAGGGGPRVSGGRRGVGMKGRREAERRARRRAASGGETRGAVMAAVVTGTVESPEADRYGGESLGAGAPELRRAADAAIACVSGACSVCFCEV
ncbi:hypothetical protein NL676_033376 [Syzygium grande]|nr:hypothetical protein NL676_033376 [Syzygium grande]